MMRACSWSLLLWLGAVASLVGQAPARTPPAATVVLEVVAHDRRGMPVMDLKPGEVEVWIGHFRVPIETFTVVQPGADERAGRLFILILDDVSVPLPVMPRVKEAAHHFVAGMRPGDQMAVVMLSDPALEMTGDVAKLRSAIDRYTVRATGLMRGDQLGAQVLNTIGGAAQSLIEAGGGRKTIVGIGSGWLLDRPIPPPGSGFDLLQEWIGAMRAMSRTGSVFYAIDPGGLDMRRRADGGDTGFARETGGLGFLATNDLKGAADRILRESASYYSLRVASPPVGGSDGLREVELKVTRRDVTVRARRAVHAVQ
ncbi:MAG TPA: VWA domain-containing protein [Vicinamibacterales bacterium]|nr:VWA domain-containing protein [Vicinamibacterales bacterium]